MVTSLSNVTISLSSCNNKEWFVRCLNPGARKIVLSHLLSRTHDPCLLTPAATILARLVILCFIQWETRLILTMAIVLAFSTADKISSPRALLSRPLSTHVRHPSRICFPTVQIHLQMEILATIVPIFPWSKKWRLL